MVAQMATIVFLLGTLYGITPFGETSLLKRVFLPNAACRYIESAPTYCYFYHLQEGLTTGYGDLFIDLFIILLVVTLLILPIGRVWCSWLCPFGFVQELLSDVRDRMNIPPLRLKWNQRLVLRQVKYAILFFTVLISASIGISALGLSGSQGSLSLPFCQICPAKGFFTAIQLLTGLITPSTRLPFLAIFMLGFFLVTSFSTRMFWCRVCPMGAYMALLNKFSLVWLHKDPNKCTKCRICLRVCPMDHDKVYEEMEGIDVGGEDCTLCGKCIEMCPEEGCLSLNFMSKSVISSRKPGFTDKMMTRGENKIDINDIGKTENNTRDTGKTEINTRDTGKMEINSMDTGKAEINSMDIDKMEINSMDTGKTEINSMEIDELTISNKGANRGNDQ